MNTSEFLKALTEASGVSGYEHAVRDIVCAEFASLCDEVSTDAMGNVWGIKRGSPGGKRIMLAGHMDEIGLVVKQIEGHVLRFTQIGGFDVRVLPGQPVWVHGRETMPGVIGMRPPHVVPASERNKVLPMEDLFVDVGLAAEEIGKYVRVGDIITLRRGYVELKNGFASAKAMDDRAGVAALHHCLQMLQHMHHRWDVYAVATVQEEMGLRGAMTSAYGVAPHAAIAVDVTHARTPDVSELQAVDADKGPGVARGPNLHPVIYERLVETAQKHEIPIQYEAIPGRSGTDAWAIQVSREGVPTGLLGLPLRYMHTPVETLSLRDVERCGRLMAFFIADLDDAILDRFKPALPEE